ncbi:MAG: penicillin-binding protein 2 [Brachybacterium sp.]|nr:penicillin-binding protein 2 [Brachybacterium sp.]
MAILPPARVGSPVVRHRLLVVVILVAIVALAGRLVWVQGLNSSALAADAVKERTATRSIPALRGDILDRNGAVLATSVERYDLWVNQMQVAEYTPRDRDEEGAAAAAEELAPVLGMSVQDTEEALTGDAGFRYLDRNVDPAVRNAVIALGIPGIGADRVASRIYPAGQVGGSVIGFVGSDGSPLAGTELSLNDDLAGTDGSTTYERGLGGQVIPTGTQETTPAVDGDDVSLTIDRDLQWKSQQVLKASVDEWGASSGSVVAIRASTGEVLALADYPTYDPNDPGASPEEHRGVQAISNVFEPGSTGKLFTFAAALEHGDVDPSTEYTIPYTETFDGHLVKDSHYHPTQQLTLAGVLKNSSNVGTVQVADTVSDELRYDYLRSFGLGQATGIELPGESAGVVHPAEDWEGRMRLTTTFGQGYSVNALQMTSAVGAFANDGVLVEPTLISGVADAEGTLRPLGEPAKHRVISPETAATMSELMDNNIPDDGTANADVPGYSVAGKTGTAQVPDGTYTSSFIGFAPADDPDVVIGVFIYGMPTFISGNTAAAPAFGQIAEYALQNQRVAPTGTPGRDLPDEWGTDAEDDSDG